MKRIIKKKYGSAKSDRVREYLQRIEKPFSKIEIDSFLESNAKPIREKQLKKYMKESNEFLKSKAWIKLRYEALRLYGRKCCLCGATNKDSVLNVDHIKPRSSHPELKLNIANLQILCSPCNYGKGSEYEDDWRLDS